MQLCHHCATRLDCLESGSSPSVDHGCDMYLLILGVALSSATALPAQDAPRPVERIALVGGTLIDGTGSAPLIDATVVVEGFRIQAVGRRRDVTIPPGTRTIDVTGKTVLPGFIDLHTHLTLP